MPLCPVPIVWLMPGQGSLVAGRSLQRSQPGLSGSAGPLSPHYRRAHDAILEGAIMILPRVSTVEVTIERETMSTDSV